MNLKRTLYLIPFIAALLYMFVGYKLHHENRKKVNLSLPKQRNTAPGIIHVRDCKKQRMNYEEHKDELDIEDPAVWNDVKFMLYFIGIGRSRTSLVGALLDAHPNIVIAHGYNVGKNWEMFTENQKTRNHLIKELYQATVKDAMAGIKQPQFCHGIDAYTYHVAHQWQGNFDRVIKVIGDKFADPLTAQILNWNTKKDSFNLIKPSNILSPIQKVVKVPFKYVFVVRNPFDISATRLYRGNNQGVKASKRKKLYEKTLGYDRNDQVSTAKWVTARFTAVRAFVQRHDIDAIVIYSEDIIRKPREELKRLCKFLSVPCHGDYVKDCSNLVNAASSNTRHTLQWDNEAKNIIIKLIQEEPMLKRYSFDN